MCDSPEVEAKCANVWMCVWREKRSLIERDGECDRKQLNCIIGKRLIKRTKLNYP
jgi:hypothetical protein